VRVCHMLLPRSSVIVLVFLISLGSMVQADEPIQLRPGFATLLKLDRSVGTIVIGDPDVAEATVQSEKTVVLTAKKTTGATNVIILDNENNEFFNARITVGGQNVGKVEIHTRGRPQLHEYYAYNCTPVCERVKDELESMPRPPATGVGPEITQVNAPPQEAPPQQAPLQQPAR
jgi:hypothetical protein